MISQTLHIFGKDVRHLWSRIAIVQLLVIAHAVLAVRLLPPDEPAFKGLNSAAHLLSILLPLGFSFLIAFAIFEEPLPGQRQFWLTRPYRWQSLLAAKLLFCLVFISLSLLLSDCYVLTAQGLSVSGTPIRLLERQGSLFLLFVMPSFIIAAVTSGIPQFVLGWFLAALILSAELMVFSGAYSDSDVAIGGIDLSSSGIAALLIVVCGIVIWQFARRSTFFSRVVLLVALAIPFPFSWSMARLFPAADRIPQLLPDNPGIQLNYDPVGDVKTENAWETGPEDYVAVYIPIKVGSLPSQTLLRGTSLPVRSSDEFGFIQIQRIHDRYWQTMHQKKSKLLNLKKTEQTTSLTIRMHFEIVNDAPAIREPLTRSAFSIPGTGLCHIFPFFGGQEMLCRTGLQEFTETAVRLDAGQSEGAIITTLTPTIPEIGLTPTSDWRFSFPLSAEHADANLAFIPRRKVAEFDRIMKLQNVPLWKFAISPQYSITGVIQ